MKKVTPSQLAELAKQFGFNLASVKAVIEIESRGSGFLPSGEPVILFERHWFSRLTKGKFDLSHPNICNRTPGGYTGKEHSQLQLAESLDRSAALQSASWGMGQVMGFHWSRLGYPSLQVFINEMFHSEEKQLVAMFKFIQTDKTLARIMRLSAPTIQNWRDFAYRYNGSKYEDNDYHNKLERAFKKHRA